MSYITVPWEKVYNRAVAALCNLEDWCKKRDQEYLVKYTALCNKRRRIFPWLKPLTPEQARQRAGLFEFIPTSAFRGEDIDRLKHIGFLCKESMRDGDGLIALSVEDNRLISRWE